MAETKAPTRQPNDTVVMDIGTNDMKFGWASQDAPLTAASIVGRPKIGMLATNVEGPLIGSDATAKRGVLMIKYPVEHGIVTNWADWELLVEHCFTHLGLKSAPNAADMPPMLFTEVPLFPQISREKLLEVMFEKFNVPSLCIAPSPSLTLIASGRTTGVVAEFGASTLHTAPIFESNMLVDATMRLDLGGRDLTDYLMKLLTEYGYCFTTSAERMIVDEMKIRHCFVAEDYEDALREWESNNKKNVEYELPDGHIIEFGSPTFRAPEALFRPCMIGLSAQGVHELTFNSINKVPIDLRRELYGNVVIGGQTGKFPGMATRLSQELTNLAPTAFKVKVVSPPEAHTTWVGGKILAELAAGTDAFMDRSTYEEYGPVMAPRCMW